MLNDDEDGGHSLRVVTETQELRLASFNVADGPLAAEIRQLRGALRRISWGDEGEWSESKGYRYRNTGDLARLKDDLAMLAVNGYRLSHVLLRSSARQGSRDIYEEADRFVRELRRPQLLQLALKDTQTRILPIALLYDYALDTSAPSYSLCPSFVNDIQDGKVVEGDCMTGRCPQSDHGANPSVVCLGGSGGFAMPSASR